MPVVVMTAWGSIDNAVEAMRRGARDYVEKPWDNSRLMSILATQIELGRALRRAQRLETENRLLRRDHLPQMIAESPKMKPVLQLMERVGPSDANVLITGEHGTGKELVAQWLHASSPRASRSFIAVNMGGLSEGLFESELFGHVKGSFTDAKVDRVGRFELADAGTLFLDEIGTVPLVAAVQAASRAADRRRRARRLVQGAARRRARHLGDERQPAARGWRRDDSAKICCFGSTRSRSSCRRFATGARTSRRWRCIFFGGTRRAIASRSTGFDAGAMQVLLAHPWPGNIRELDHAVERAVLLAQGDQIRAVDLGLRASTAPRARLEDLPLEDVEKMLIQKALARYEGNVSRAAQALGLSRSALYRRIASYGL